MPEALFVYGTLMRGYTNSWARKLWSCSDPLGPATTLGRMYSLGWCPALKPGTETIHGEVASVRDPSVLKQLDDYEGADYTRVLQSVTLAQGTAVEAWIYLYTGPVDERAHIASGRFLQPEDRNQ